MLRSAFASINYCIDVEIDIDYLPHFRDFCHEEAVLEKSYATARNLEKLTSTSAQQGVEAKNYIKSNNKNDENIKIRT